MASGGRGRGFPTAVLKGGGRVCGSSAGQMGTGKFWKLLSISVFLPPNN